MMVRGAALAPPFVAKALRKGPIPVNAPLLGLQFRSADIEGRPWRPGQGARIVRWAEGNKDLSQGEPQMGGAARPA